LPDASRVGSKAAGLAACDITLPHALLALRTDAQGRWSQSVPVPSSATLDGLDLLLQAAIGPTATAPLGLDLTNPTEIQVGK